MSMEKIKKKELTEVEKVELRKFAYELSFRFPMEKCHEEIYKTYENWRDEKAKKIYKWLLEGEG